MKLCLGLGIFLLLGSVFSCATRKIPSTQKKAGSSHVTLTDYVFRDAKSTLEKGKRRIASQNKTLSFRMIHSNDIHSAMLMFPYLGAYIEDQRKQAISQGILPIVTDAGDFYSGSLSHTLGPRMDGNAKNMNPELEFFRRHDVVMTFGNHEWDATQEGLVIMIRKLTGGKRFPGGIVATNMLLKNTDSHKHNALSPYFFDGIMVLDKDRKIQEAYTWDTKTQKHTNIDPTTLQDKPIVRALIRDYEVDGKTFRVGFVGLMGPSAVGGSEVTRAHSGVEFEKYDSLLVAQYIARLRDLQADIIVAIPHGGKQPEGVSGPEEDKILAYEIPGIDIVAAGHTHAGYAAKKAEASMIRFQSPAYGQAVVSDIDFTEKVGELAVLNLKSSEVIVKDSLIEKWKKSNETYKAGAKISQNEIEEWKKEFDRMISEDHRYRLDDGKEIHQGLELLKIQQDSVAAKELGDFTSYESKGPLCNLVTTAVREELNEVLLKEGKRPVDLFLTVIELVRSEFPTHRPTYFSDIFGMVSRGVVKHHQHLIPDGGQITVMDMDKSGVYHLIALLEFWARKVEVEASPTFSEGVSFQYKGLSIPLVNSLGDFKINGVPYKQLPKILHIAMPTFLSKNFREKVYGAIDATLAKQINPREADYTMDILLARYLYKHRLKIESYGVLGTANERALTLKKQEERWAHRELHHNN